MGLAHVAQLRIPLYDLKLAISIQSDNTLLRTCWGPFGLAQLLGWSGHAGRVTLPLIQGFALCLGMWPRRSAALPWLRAGGGY
jgi:hypothetical protein